MTGLQHTSFLMTVIVSKIGLSAKQLRKIMVYTFINYLSLVASIPFFINLVTGFKLSHAPLTLYLHTPFA